MQISTVNLNNSQKRYDFLDLTRVIAMVMICILHLLPQDGIGFDIKIASAICVNVYILITGYIHVNLKYKLSRALNIWFQVVFYIILLDAIQSWIVPNITFDSGRILKEINPITGSYWFIDSYIILFMAIPFLNKMVKSLTQHQYILLLLLFPGLAMLINRYNITLFFWSGYNYTWFIALYLCGAYLRLYPIRITLTKAIFLYAGSLLAALIISHTWHSMGEYSHYVVWAESILFFILMQQIHINNKTVLAFFRFLSPLTLGVYLIHEHGFCKGLIHSYLIPNLPNKEVWFYLLVFIPGIYFICSAFDWIRSLIFMQLRIRSIAETLGKYIEKLVHYGAKCIEMVTKA